MTGPEGVFGRPKHNSDEDTRYVDMAEGRLHEETPPVDLAKSLESVAVEPVSGAAQTVEDAGKLSGVRERLGIHAEIPLTEEAGFLEHVLESAAQGGQMPSPEELQRLSNQSPEMQGQIAGDFFKSTVGDAEMPKLGKLDGVYKVYAATKGTEFATTFHSLEDARLKKYGYGPFTL